MAKGMRGDRDGADNDAGFRLRGVGGHEDTIHRVCVGVASDD